MSANNPRRPIGQRLMAWLFDRKFISDGRMLEFYPPFWWMRIKVLEMDPLWNRVRIRLPLHTFSRNPGGSMFGGHQASLSDPIPALACSRRYAGYEIWTRALHIDFERGGQTDLEMRFEFPPELDATIRAELAADGRSTPTFEYGFYLADGTRCTHIRNTVAIRPRGYASARTKPRPPSAS